MKGYKSVMVNEEILKSLVKLAKFRGVSLQDILLELISLVDDVELEEAGIFGEL